MIEDDLRAIVASGLTGTDTYARLIPLPLPECAVVQADGGVPSTSTIRRATHRVTVLAVSDDRAKADRILRSARDVLVRAMPCDVSGTHYYHARPLAEGCITQARPQGQGTAYVAHATLEVLASL